MTLFSILRRLLSPLIVGLVVLVVQPLTTVAVIQTATDRPDMPRWLATIWYALFLPSTCLHFIVRAVTHNSPAHFFGSRSAEIDFALPLNAVVWALIAFFICFAVQRHLTRRWSERLAALNPHSP